MALHPSPHRLCPVGIQQIWGKLAAAHTCTRCLCMPPGRVRACHLLSCCALSLSTTPPHRMFSTSSALYMQCVRCLCWRCRRWWASPPFHLPETSQGQRTCACPPPTRSASRWRPPPPKTHAITCAEMRRRGMQQSGMSSYETCPACMLHRTGDRRAGSSTGVLQACSS